MGVNLSNTKKGRQEMKGKLFALGLALLLAPLLAGCGLISVTGSGNVVTQEEAITGFDKVDITQGFTVDISQGDTFSVVIQVDDNLVQYLRVVKEDSTLKIGLDRNRSYKDATLKVEVTMPELTGLDLSLGSHANITGFKSPKALDADLSGGSHLRGDIEAGSASFSLSGGSDLTLSGSGQDVSIKASGGSQINLGDFPVADASVNASDGSEVTVKPSGRLDANASSGSKVYYLGNPTNVTSNTTEGAEVRPK
jgi:hypothetical protein